ncbi:MAG TPA: ABC transporter ATP-binding protein [Cellvibrionaceae bacterium]
MTNPATNPVTSPDADQQQPVVVIDKLQRQLQGLTVLNDINAVIQPGNVIGLLGKNGAGKTTLLETLLGFGLPTFGKVKLWGECASELSADNKQRIGYVPQTDELMLMMNGEDHLKLYRSLRPRWNQPLVDKLCDEWEIPLSRMARKMSVGERQKLSIVLALAHEPDLLVLDEPVAALDPVARRQFIQQLVDVAGDDNRAIIFSSHIVSDMERIANRIWLLENASLAWQQGQDELKETVLRLSWRNTGAPMPALEGVLHEEVTDFNTVVVVKNATNSLRAELEAELNTQVQVDYLSLEDIFLYFSANRKPLPLSQGSL